MMSTYTLGRHELLLTGYLSYGKLISMIKQEFFQAVVMSVLLYGCTTCTNKHLGGKKAVLLYGCTTCTNKTLGGKKAVLLYVAPPVLRKHLGKKS